MRLLAIEVLTCAVPSCQQRPECQRRTTEKTCTRGLRKKDVPSSVEICFGPTLGLVGTGHSFEPRTKARHPTLAINRAQENKKVQCPDLLKIFEDINHARFELPSSICGCLEHSTKLTFITPWDTSSTRDSFKSIHTLRSRRRVRAAGSFEVISCW